MNKKNKLGTFTQDDLVAVLEFCHSSLTNAYEQHLLLQKELASVGELARLTSVYFKSQKEEISG